MTSASLSPSGKMPDYIELLTSLVSKGKAAGSTSFSRPVCTGSDLQHLLGDFLMILATSSSVRTLNFSNLGGGCDTVSNLGCGGMLAIFSCSKVIILVILVTKKLLKFSANCESVKPGGIGDSWFL